MTDKEWEEIARQNYELGEVVQQEEIVENLLDRTGKFYVVGRDVEAKIFRDLADELKKKAVEMRQKLPVEYRS